MTETIYPDISDAGMRLDVYLSDLYPNNSRSYIQKLIRDGLVYNNGVPVKKNYCIKGGECLEFTVPAPVSVNISAEDIPLDILYEDDWLVFVNKPRGMVVHPGAGHMSGTLVNALMYHCGDSLSGINGALRPGIVHRIDKDTSGVLVICKDDQTHRLVAEQFAVHSITRRYFAIAHGLFKEKEGIVDQPLGRSKLNRLKICIRPDGKRAVTNYKVLDETAGYSLISCELETGRTHQIRVHMDSISHPLLGDELYGNRPNPFGAKGQTLHAGFLGLKHPVSGEYIEVMAELPDYFTELMSKAGLKADII